jgi:hypothetical protein
MSQKGILWAIPNPQKPILIGHLYSKDTPPLHITLQYGVQRADWAWLIGREFTAVIVQQCWNDRVQALRVFLPEGIPCCNLHPHITVSWVEGAEPAEANEMLADESGATWRQAWKPLEPIRCRVEFFAWPSEAVISGVSEELS